MNLQLTCRRLALIITGLALLDAYAEGFNTLCYWTVWSQGRPGDYALKPDKIDPYLCSHLIYAFGVVGPGLTLDLETSRYPAAPQSIRALNNLKMVNRNLKTLISVGGASKGPEAFLLPASDERSRAQFAQNTITFCRENNLDGIDVDWEYPENGTSFTLLIQALRKGFDQEPVPAGKTRLLLTAAVSVSQAKIYNTYDVHALNNALDFFNVMAYDFHGSWGSFAGFNSPLYPRPSNPRIFPQLNAAWAVEQYIKRGASRSKIILGLASYGRAFKLTDRTQHDVAAPIERSSHKGPVLQDEEYRMYPEVCDFINNNRARYMFDEEQASAFVYTIDYWIGYDNPKAFHLKTQYAIQQKLAGVLVWTLDYDDVSGNHCGLGKFPLTKAIKNTIAGITSLIPSGPLRLYEPELLLPKPAENSERYKRVCYFTNWSTLRPAAKGLFSLDDINLDICTHLIYAYAFVDEIGYSVLPLNQGEESTSSAEADTGLMERFNSLKRYNTALRTMLSVGGTTAGTNAFEIISKDDNSRRRFARNVIEYLEIWGFNGLEIVWKYPGQRFRNHFTRLLQVIREEFNKYETKNSGVKLILSISVSGENPQMQDSYEIAQISEHLDFLTVLADTYKRTDKRTYFVSPLRKSDSDAMTAELNQEWSVNQWINGGAPAQKILLGLIGMGRSFTLASTSMTSPGSPFVDQNVTGAILGERGIMLQYEICDFITRGATEVFDSEQVAAYAYLDDLWVSYEDRRSVEEKVKWLKSNGLGGYSFWTLDYDDFTGRYCNCGKYPLLTSAYQADKGLPVDCFGGDTRPVDEGSPPPDLKPIATTEKPKPPKTNFVPIVVRRDPSGASNISQSITSLIILVILQRLYFR